MAVRPGSWTGFAKSLIAVIGWVGCSCFAEADVTFELHDDVNQPTTDVWLEVGGWAGSGSTYDWYEYPVGWGEDPEYPHATSLQSMSDSATSSSFSTTYVEQDFDANVNAATLRGEYIFHSMGGA
ncbi:MAG: hypothetical protein H0T47_09765 [Planctomycetaceae bacterium]|nr:hypothetical protein [Planctomycetaceae bacterium]